MATSSGTAGRSSLSRSRTDQSGPILTCLFTLAFLTAVSSGGTGPSADGPAEEKKNAPRDDDYWILEAVFVDLIDFKEFSETFQDAKKTYIVLREQTAGASGYLSDDELNGEHFDEKTYFIPAEIRDDLRRRNPKEPVSLREFKPSSAKILVRELNELKHVRPRRVRFEFVRICPIARGYVVSWLPGYSKDGQTAVVRALWGPTPHGATTTYMLKNERGNGQSCGGRSHVTCEMTSPNE
jgi:hypothetical protein